MEGIGSEELKKFIPEEKCLAILMIDGIAIDERLSVDTSIVPMSFMGLCRHCADPSFNTMADTVRIKAGLNNKAFHLAKEAHCVCIRHNSKRSNSLIPVAISPTCKKDE